MEVKKKYFMDCHLAGRKYHDADEVWDKLKVGTLLQLVRSSKMACVSNPILMPPSIGMSRQ